MLSFIRKYPIITLVFTAIICGLLWRIEVEYQGWAGLIWLTYFHFAIPIGFVLFAFWANLFIKIDWKRRILINVATFAYGIVIYYSLGISLTFIFAGGPSGFLLIMQTPEWQIKIFRYSIFVIIPFIPIGAFLILKAFNQGVPIIFLILAIVSIIISVPLSTLILELVNHKGGCDCIHSIKSGVLIPLWIFSIGILVIGISRNKNATKNIEAIS